MIRYWLRLLPEFHSHMECFNESRCGLSENKWPDGNAMSNYDEGVLGVSVRLHFYEKPAKDVCAFWDTGLNLCAADS